MLDQLIPSRRSFPVDEPIFSLNAEAQQRKAAGESILNATIGALTDDQGQLVVLESMMEVWRELTPQEIAPYAPIAGHPAYLKALVQRHWPKLDDYGVGCATPGGSGALALSVKNLLEPGMSLLTAAPFWGPYNLLAAEGGAKVTTAPFKEPGKALDTNAWYKAASALLKQQGRLLIWLNDPCHNPTGMSLGQSDRTALLEVLREVSSLGPITLLLDCAYLDYTNDPYHVREALDEYAAFGAEGIVLVGAALSLSKSLTLYGGRAGALVFPWCQETALQAALSTSCRGLFSNCAMAPQSLLVRLQNDPKRTEKLGLEHRHWSEVIETRSVALNNALHHEGLTGSPWHGGFFVTLRMEAPAAVADRLKAHGVYVVPLQEGLRVGICGLRSTDAHKFASALKASL